MDNDLWLNGKEQGRHVHLPMLTAHADIESLPRSSGFPNMGIPPSLLGRAPQLHHHQASGSSQPGDHHGARPPHSGDPSMQRSHSTAQRPQTPVQRTHTPPQPSEAPGQPRRSWRQGVRNVVGKIPGITGKEKKHNGPPG